jgi:hypothetical protein
MHDPTHRRAQLSHLRHYLQLLYLSPALTVSTHWCARQAGRLSD